MSTRRSFIASSLACAGTVAVPVGRTLRAATPRFETDPFTLGIASGYPTPSSVVLWTRLAPDPLSATSLAGMPERSVRVGWELAHDDAFRDVVRRGTELARPQACPRLGLLGLTGLALAEHGLGRNPWDNDNPVIIGEDQVAGADDLPGAYDRHVHRAQRLLHGALRRDGF